MFWSCVLHEQGNSHHKTWKAFSFLCTIIMVLLFKEHCRDAFLPSHESDNTNASPERVLFRERKGPHHTRNSRSTSYVCTYIEKWQYIWLLSFVWYGHFRFMFCEQSGSKEIHSLESTKINHESINFSFRERLEVVERMKNKRNTQDCLNVTLNTLTVDREAPGKKLGTIKIPKFFSLFSKFGKFPFLDNDFQDQQTVCFLQNSLSSCLTGFYLTVCLFQKQWTPGLWFSWYHRRFVVFYEWLTIVLCILALPKLSTCDFFCWLRNSFWL